MESEIYEQLKSMAEEKYRVFSARLLPEDTILLGVRLPKLRALAKRVAGENWQTYLERAQSRCMEEVMLQGMIIGAAECDVPQRLTYINAFVPKIDNWSVCDSFCVGLKFTAKNRDVVWDFLTQYHGFSQEYVVRFSLVMMLQYYIDEVYIGRVLKRIDELCCEGYYAKMAAAWALSVCYIKQPEITRNYLRQNRLDDYTYNKALQKILESYRVSGECKNEIRALKRPVKTSLSGRRILDET